jgi:hypothetical protein
MDEQEEVIAEWEKHIQDRHYSITKCRQMDENQWVISAQKPDEFVFNWSDFKSIQNKSTYSLLFVYQAPGDESWAPVSRYVFEVGAYLYEISVVEDTKDKEYQIHCCSKFKSDPGGWNFHEDDANASQPLISFVVEMMRTVLSVERLQLLHNYSIIYA